MISNIYKIICEALTPYGVPISEQGSYDPDDENDALPETFFTYQVIYDEAAYYADNKPIDSIELIQIALYSTDPVIKQSAKKTLDSLLITTGFLRAGGGDLAFERKTGHYGYACDYRYYLPDEEE